VCAVLAASIWIDRQTPVIRGLGVAPLRWLGTVSYGLYLWHWPVFIIIDQESTGFSRPVVSVLRWSVSLALAAASFRFLESPIRYGRRLGTARAGLGALGAAALVVVASAVLTPQPAESSLSVQATQITLPTTSVGSSDATSPVVTTNQTSSTDGPTSSAATMPPMTTVVTSATTPGAAPAATTDVTSSPTTVPGARTMVATVAWQGDSVAFDSAPGVIAALQASGPSVSSQAFLGVGLVDHDNIQPFALFVDPLAQTPPDLVVFMLSGWDGGFDEATQREAFNAYADAWQRLGSALVVLEPPPVNPARHENTTDTMLAIARERAALFPDEVVVLDAIALWGEFATDIDGDGQPERKPDGVHVCPTGAALLGYWLSNELAQLFDGIVPADPSEWVGGDWVNEQRYDDPPGACR